MVANTTASAIPITISNNIRFKEGAIESKIAAKALEEIKNFQQHYGELIGLITKESRIDITSIGTYYNGRIKLSSSISVGGKLQVPYWTDTDGYYMTGVSGKVAVAMELGASLFWGIHENGEKMKIIIGLHHCEFTIVALWGNSGFNPKFEL